MTAPFTEPGSWNHAPRAALARSHGPILPMGTVLPVERVKRPLLARLFRKELRRG